MSKSFAELKQEGSFGKKSFSVIDQKIAVSFDKGSTWIEINDISEVELPNIESSTEALSGAGMSGTVEFPNGKINNMTMTLTGGMIDEIKINTLAHKTFDIRFACVYNVVDKFGTASKEGNKIYATVTCGSINYGNSTTGEKISSSIALTVLIFTQMDGFNKVIAHINQFDNSQTEIAGKKTYEDTSNYINQIFQ